MQREIAELVKTKMDLVLKNNNELKTLKIA
jgi:hypothetical protein